MRVSKRLQELAPSQTDAFSAKARSLKAKGIDVIDFGLGEPDFNTPDNIKEAGIKAIKEGFTKYTSPGGIAELKKAIAEKLFRDNGIKYEISEVTAACGAKQALFNVFMGIINPGDEFILPAPYWVSYPNQIQLAEGKTAVIKTKQEDDYQISLEDLKNATSEKTAGILINTPCNPTGAVYNQRTLETIAEWAVRGNYIVISDEINEKFIYDGLKHISIASLGKEIFERTITINGVSKTYAMTGWRIGYAAGQKELISAIERLVSHSTSQPSSISQKAAIEALSGDQKSVEEMREVYDKRRRYIWEELNKIKCVKFKMPSGAFYAFPDVSAFYEKEICGRRINNSFDLANLLLDEAQVAVVPGAAFGDDAFIRISYATSMRLCPKSNS